MVLSQAEHSLGARSGRHVRGQISPAKTVNGLLGVTDHDERGRFGRTRINLLQSAVLPRIGVLKFIDQGHWELLPNDFGQVACRCFHCIEQVFQQIGKIKCRMHRFVRCVSLPDLLRSMAQQAFANLRLLSLDLLPFFKRCVQAPRIGERRTRSFDRA